MKQNLHGRGGMRFAFPPYNKELLYRIEGGCYFFTVNLLERKNTLLVDHIELLRAI